jgi:hypothetical protein
MASLDIDANRPSIRINNAKKKIRLATTASHLRDKIVGIDAANIARTNASCFGAIRPVTGGA